MKEDRDDLGPKAQKLHVSSSIRLSVHSGQFVSLSKEQQPASQKYVSMLLGLGVGASLFRNLLFFCSLYSTLTHHLNWKSLYPVCPPAVVCCPRSSRSASHGLSREQDGVSSDYGGIWSPHWPPLERAVVGENEASRHLLFFRQRVAVSQVHSREEQSQVQDQVLLLFLDYCVCSTCSSRPGITGDGSRSYKALRKVLLDKRVASLKKKKK